MTIAKWVLIWSVWEYFFTVWKYVFGQLHVSTDVSLENVFTIQQVYSAKLSQSLDIFICQNYKWKLILQKWESSTSTKPTKLHPARSLLYFLL